jgi:predicted HAD superfamily Cof-like phosphohydrolase
MDSKTVSVIEFNKAFNIIRNKKPSLISKQEYNLRVKLMSEELTEYQEACDNDDLTEVCDAIVDLLYVLNGIIVAHGIQDIVEDMYDEVHRSNMSKLENGKPLYRSDGKVMKGSEYFRPNLIKYINE